jgi:hypothetical protein
MRKKSILGGAGGETSGEQHARFDDFNDFE